jgi:hypothetical protein
VLTALVAGLMAAPAQATPHFVVRARGVAQRGGVPDSAWLSRHCTSLPLVVAQ